MSDLRAMKSGVDQYADKLHEMTRRRVLFRAREMGIFDRMYLPDHAMFTQFARGLYASEDSNITFTEAMLFRTEHAVACLDTALWLLEILGDEPRPIRLAISRDARKPKIDTVPIDWFRWSEPADPDDIVTLRRISNGPWVKAFGVAKTAVDLVRARRRVGVERAYELVDYLLGRHLGVDELRECAARYRASLPVRECLRRLT